MTIFGTLTLAEIQSQPECWEQAAKLAASTRLPTSGERVLVLGCGTSYYIAQAYAMLREAAGHGLTDAVVASEMPHPLRRTYDRVIAISRSGTSIELLMAVGDIPSGLPIMAILGDLKSPLAGAGHEVVDLGFADEQSVVQTRFATSALSLLRASLGEDLRPDIKAVREALTDDLPTLPQRQLVVVAHGWSVALAHEAALKCREAAAEWVEAYAAGEYRHGPLAVADGRTLVWGLTNLPKTLVEAITSTGALVQQPTYAPQVELVRLQRLAVAWAIAKGRNADHPKYLGRSVVHI
jgi:fructoselysine-6-P-deglycase FrlB-like protein